MGMSSSQARLLTLTGRMHDIEYKAARLEAQKLQMANESSRVYENYLNALDAAKIQYKSLNNDGSIKFNDANYYDLLTGKSGTQFVLCSTSTGKALIPQAIADKYNAASSAADFATSMTGYVPPIVPIDPTPTPIPGPIPDPGPTPEPTPVTGTDITLNMGESKSTTITDPVTVTLNNTFNGGNYTYSVIGTGSPATFTYLKNGRLVIQGNNLNIMAGNSQADDIILLGNNNSISTSDGDDKIRIGGAQDSSYSSYTQTSTGNTVYAGNGNDYIQVYKGSGNTIDGGDGTDTLLSTTTNSTSGIEKTMASYNTTDGVLSWSMQQYYGDCQFLSLVNSINAKGKFAEHFEITQSGSNWTVKFKKSNVTTTVSASDITGYATIGDKDITVLEAAFRKLITAEGYNLGEEGTDETHATGTSDNFHIVSKYVLGMDSAMCVEFHTGLFSDLWYQYNSGAISNLVIGSNQDATGVAHELGIMEQHAYSVTNVTSDTVTVVNPHDSKDSITLKKSDFYNYFGSIILYGDTYDYVSSQYHIAKGIEKTTVSEENNNSDENTIYLQNSNYVFGADAAEEYNYYFNLYNAIKEAGGCEIISESLIVNQDYLVNVLNGGFAYLRNYDNNSKTWVDTSVATNTSLQEVNNEKELKKAEAKYEADMRRIDLKDRKYDTELAALDTERNAIKQEIDTLKTVAKENVERTFKLFS